MPKDIEVVSTNSNAPDGNPPEDDCAIGTASKGRCSPPEENFARRASNRLVRKRLIAQKLPNTIESVIVGHPSQDQDRGVRLVIDRSQLNVLIICNSNRLNSSRPSSSRPRSPGVLARSHRRVQDHNCQKQRRKRGGSEE